MDHQLKQAALPCRLSGEHFGDHYLPLTYNPALANGAPLLCRCGSGELLAVAPGYEDERSEIGTLVARGVAARGWCSGCLPMMAAPP